MGAPNRGYPPVVWMDAWWASPKPELTRDAHRFGDSCPRVDRGADQARGDPRRLEVVDGQHRRQTPACTDCTHRIKVAPDAQAVAGAMIEAKPEDKPPAHGLE